MKKITLRVISKPDPNSCAILDLNNGAKFNGKKGEVTLACGGCGKILAEKIEDKQLRNLILRCECGAYNRIPMMWERFHLRDIKESWNIKSIILGLLFLVISQFIPGYSSITFWIGILFSLLGTLFLLTPKKIIRYFSEE